NDVFNLTAPGDEVGVAGSQAARGLHPRHGIHAPTGGTPERPSGSVRRPARMDMVRPDGLLGPLVLTGRARDLGTGLDRVGTVLATSECTARIDFMAGRALTEISTSPDRPALQALLGLRVSSGFRSAVAAADPRLSAEDSLLNLLLDDFPVATLVSGHAIGAGLAVPRRAALSLSAARTGATGRPESGQHRFQRDLCAGFADGGTI